MFTKQKLITLAYTLITVLLLLAAAYLYSKGLSKKPESFGLGLSYVLPGVACLGLAIVTGIVALLESASAKQHRVRACEIAGNLATWRGPVCIAAHRSEVASTAP